LNAAKVNVALGRLRLLAGEMAKAIPADRFAFTWVTDFPCSEERGRTAFAMHHPFTARIRRDYRCWNGTAEGAGAGVRHRANGVELGGGSIRIHVPRCKRRCSMCWGSPNRRSRSGSAT
jgi:aspartyl-tRNA synthetase